MNHRTRGGFVRNASHIIAFDVMCECCIKHTHRCYESCSVCALGLNASSLDRAFVVLCTPNMSTS